MTVRRAWKRVGRPLNEACGAALLLGLGCASQPPPQSVAPSDVDVAASARRSLAADRENVSITVYNSNFALVREQRRLALGSGRVALAFEDVSAHIQPATVHLRSLDAPDGLSVLEQNYRYDLLSPETLLDKYVGKRLRVARYDESRGEDEVIEAELLSVQNGPVLRVNGEVVSGLGGRFIFPELPPSLLERPTLVWLLDSTRDDQRVELSYLTANLSWHADYVLVLDASDTRGDLSAWVTLENQSGTSFTGAQLKLVAGDVQRVTPPAPPPAPVADFDVAEEAAAGNAFQQEALFEYHLYSLERPTDVLDKEQKQVSLLEARGIELQKKLVFPGNGDGFHSVWRDNPEPRKPNVVVVLDNSEQKGIGVPLPQGTLRVYKADASGAQQFVGEDTIEHTPRDEKLEAELGQAFDVVGARRQTAFRALGKCSAESAWAFTIDNHKDAAAAVQVHEIVNGGYELVESSQPPSERDAQGFTLEANVPANGKVELTYRIRVRWC